jgi:hypothetical protein
MANQREAVKIAIQSAITAMMDRVMTRVLVEDPFRKDKHRATRPLYAALVPDEIFKGSHFERRFVTPFGKAWQTLAVVAGSQSPRRATQEHIIQGTVKRGRLARIQDVLNSLEHAEPGQRKTRPDWSAELAHILGGGGKDIPVSVIVDVYVEDTASNLRCAFELKAPLPNSDQTKVSKEKLLKLYAMEPAQVEEAYYALPYNPYGRREDYNWSFPARWFDMRNDQVVLIGREFWDKIGGKGTYQAFIEAVNDIGPAYKNRVYREFLGIEPPASLDEVRL